MTRVVLVWRTTRRVSQSEIFKPFSFFFKCLLLFLVRLVYIERRDVLLFDSRRKNEEGLLHSVVILKIS